MFRKITLKGTRIRCIEGIPLNEVIAGLCAAREVDPLAAARMLMDWTGNGRKDAFFEFDNNSYVEFIPRQ